MGRGAGFTKGPFAVSRRTRNTLAVLLAILLAAPGSAWLTIQAVEQASAPAPAAPPPALDTKIDPRLPAEGVFSLLVSTSHPLTTEERAAVQAIPGLRLVHEFRYVDGFWATADLRFLQLLADLPVVSRISPDPILTPTLDRSARSLGARDGRAGTLGDGSSLDFSERGLWRGTPGDLQGYTGNNVTIALLDGGIDTSHPGLDDLDDNPDTTDPKVTIQLNAFEYAVLNATIGPAGTAAAPATGAAFPVLDQVAATDPTGTVARYTPIVQEVGEVQPGYPYAIGDPGPQPNQPIPTECDLDPTGLYCSTVRPIANSYLGIVRGGYPIICAATCISTPNVDDLVPVPLPVGVPGVAIPQVSPGGNLQDTTGQVDLLKAPLATSSLPHATALAAAMAGTGDVTAAGGQSTVPRWAYMGIAPGARLADVNVFVGVDSPCLPDQAGAALSGDQRCPAGSQGTAQGVQTDGPNVVLAQAGSGLITGAEMVQQYNEKYSPSADKPVINVAVIPLLDTQDCSSNNHHTLMEAAVDKLAQTNVTVITSVGQGRTGVCVPANVPRTLAIGAMDGKGTIDRSDDTPWDGMAKAADTQKGLAKPDLVAPGVNIMTARSQPNDYYSVSGSSVAAAQAAGAAALVLEATGKTLQGIRLKTWLIQTADGSLDGSLAPNRYVDGKGGKGDSNGVNDLGNRTGWGLRTGFGTLDARQAVCGLGDQCPQAWERVGTAVLPDPARPFPLTARVGNPVTFQGRVQVRDPRAGAFWQDAGTKTFYSDFGPAPGGVPVYFGFSGGLNPDLDKLSPAGSTLTKPDGTFNLTFDIAKTKAPGTTFCAIWSGATPETATRDGLARSPALPCLLSVFSTTEISVDLCGEDKTCDPGHPFVAFLNDPSVDFLRGKVTLRDAAGLPIEDQPLHISWDGARPGSKETDVISARNTGEALIKLPVDGVPGTFVLNVSYLPREGSGNEAATVSIPVSVSLGTRATLAFDDGLDSGAVLLNDGSTLPVSVTGTLSTFLGDPVARAPIELSVEGRLQKVLGAAQTDLAGHFSATLDARPLQAGSYALYVRYAGQQAPGSEGYVLLPTTSFRVPFTVVVQPTLTLPSDLVVHRGERTVVNGTMVNAFNRPVGNETVVLDWIGSSTFQQAVRTDRNGKFHAERVMPADEGLGSLLLRATFAGSRDLAPAEASHAVEVRGRSLLSIFPGEVQRGGKAALEGLLYDDTGRPLAGQDVKLRWGGDDAGTARTDTVGHFGLQRAVAADERTGPVTVRALYAGAASLEQAAAQSTVGVIAPTTLTVDTGAQSSSQVLQFTTRLLDDAGHPITDPQDFSVYVAPPREPTTDPVTLLTPLDLSSTLAPELQLRHAYDFATGFGVSDGAHLQVSLDKGRTWATVQPRTGYPDQHVAALGGPGWTGKTSGWFPQSANLTALKGEGDVRLRWRTATNGLNNDLKLGIDQLRVADGSKVVFADDFERFGAKDGANSWTVPEEPFGFVQGQEQVSGDHALVLATNLDGTYAPDARQFATSPAFAVPAGRSFLLLRYHLGVADGGDFATLSLKRADGATLLLHPAGDARAGQLPDTRGAWRWLLYELPASVAGAQVQAVLSFQSNGLLQSTGLQVDAFRLLAAPTVTPLPVTDDPNHWTLSNFKADFPRDLDTYVVSQDTRAYAAPAAPALTGLAAPALVAPPFPIDFFGVKYDRVTVYPQGVAALGDTRDQDPSAFCRNLPTGQACHIAGVAGFGAPLVAPAWDGGLRPGPNAFVATSASGVAPNRQYTVEWRGLEAIGAVGEGGVIRFQAVFFENGDVEYRYGNLFFNSPGHDIGANATVGLGQPGVPLHTVEVSAHAASLTDNLRVSLSRVATRPVDEVNQACASGPGVCRVLGPSPTGTYAPSATSEAVLESGVDLAHAGDSFLVVRQFVQMGRGDALKVQARPFGSTSWRNLPVLMGGQSSLDGAFTPDSPGQWATVVYDLSALAGQRAKLRLQITADSAGQGVGVLVRELYAVTLPQTVVGGLDETFTSYLDTSGSGRWWSARTLTGSEVQPPWGRLPHAAGVPEELGGSYLGLGDGKAALPANTQFLLTSPPMDLRGTSNPTLQWWQTFQPTDGADGTVLEVSTDGGVSFRPLEPDGHTYVDDAPALDGPGWAGPQFGFVTDTFDLTPYASSDVRLRLASAVGPDPFASRWLLDDVKVVDRLGSSKPLLSEDGLFLTQRWNREAGQWQDVPLATAIASGRSGLDPVKVVQATGAATAHSIALPASTPRGPLVATVLYGGLAKTYGGAVKTSDLFLQLQSQLVGLQLANDLDGGDTLLRGRTFTVQGRLQGVDGSALAERLIQVFLDGQAVGSARTGADGHFQTGPILAAKALELGQRTLRVAYGGDAFDYVVGTAVERPYALKGIAQLQLESQVARGDTLEVAVRILDDVGKPLARTGAVVTVDGADPQQVVTDGNGRATFTTPVPVDKDTQVVYAVAAVGSQDVLGSDLKQETLVPAAPAASLLPWVVGAAALLLAVAVALAVYLLRRRKAVELQAALAAQVERTRYQLSTGDPLRESIFALYAGFLEALRAAGRPASDVQTPREIAASLRSALKGADQADVDQLTDLFSRARYSDAPLGEPARGAAVGCLDRIRGALAPEAAA